MDLLLYILTIYGSAFVFGFLYRFLLKRVASRSQMGAQKNIGKPDRVARIVIGCLLLGWAGMTSWNPLLLFVSGFAFFESIFSWCGLYAVLGKNTCPL